jgi:hypothetical protein
VHQVLETRIGAQRVEGWPREDRGIKASFYLTPKMDCTLEMRQVGWAHFAGTASVPIEKLSHYRGSPQERVPDVCQPTFARPTVSAAGLICRC